MRKFSKVFVTILVATLAISTSVSASAAPRADLPPQIIGGGSQLVLGADFLIDLQNYADQYGISLAQAVETFGGQEEFAAAVEQIKSTAPDTYSTSRIESGEGYSATISFTALPSDETLDVLRALPIHVRATFDAPTSERSYVQLQETIAAALVEAGHTNIVVVLAPDDASMLVQYSAPAGSGPELESIALAAAERLGSTFPLVFVESDKISAETFAAVGGQTAGGGCTAAFTVTKGPWAGISNVEHCSHSNYTYDGLSATYQGVSTNAAGGVMWHRLSGTVTNKFRYTPAGGQRVVTSAVNPVAGAAICYWGFSTGNNCATVGNANLCVTLWCSVTSMTNAQQFYGDSGGPWYFGNVAKALTIGAYTDSFGTYDFASRVGNLAAYGLTVRVTP